MAKEEKILVAQKQAAGKRWRDLLASQLFRFKNRKKRPIKPAPHGRAALVRRQKKARPKV